MRHQEPTRVRRPQGSNAARASAQNGQTVVRGTAAIVTLSRRQRSDRCRRAGKSLAPSPETFPHPSPGYPNKKQIQILKQALQINLQRRRVGMPSSHARSFASGTVGPLLPIREASSPRGTSCMSARFPASASPNTVAISNLMASNANNSRARLSRHRPLVHPTSRGQGSRVDRTFRRPVCNQRVCD